MLRSDFQSLNLIRRQNQKNVLSHLKENHFSCAELSKLLHLSNTAMGKIMDEFVACNLVRIIDTDGPLPRGRKPVLYELNPDFGCFATCDLMGEDLKLSLFDLAGTKLDSEKLEGVSEITPQVLDTLVSKLKSMAARSLGKRPLKFICIGTPGKIDPQTGYFVIAARYPDCRRINLHELFTREFGCEVAVKNDVKLAFLGELTRSRPAPGKNALYLHIDYGVNGCLYLGGKIWEGEPGFVSEFGSTRDFNGDGIGKYITIDAINRNYQHLLTDKLTAIPLNWRDSFRYRSAGEFRELLLQKDSAAVDAVRQSARVLAIAALNLYYMVDFHTIILHGNLTGLGDFYLDCLHDYFGDYIGYDHDVSVSYALLGEEAVTVGALDYAVDSCVLSALQNLRQKPPR